MLHVLEIAMERPLQLRWEGHSPYTYQWDDPLMQTTITAFNLCAQTYNCYYY